MPVFMPTDEMQTLTVPGPANFKFSGQRPESLGASEYTLVTAACDISSSVQPFQKDFNKMVEAIVGACKKNDRAENLLFRLLVFNEVVTEVHGFIDLNNVDLDSYKSVLKAGGWTSLYDATYDAVGATLEYARTLIKQDYDCNGAAYIITDGMDNRSKTTALMIAEQLANAIGREEIESMNTVLIGLHDPNLHWSSETERHLNEFKEQAKLTAFVNVGEATPQKLAKVVEWVSQSVSSQSQALGKGQASQLLNF
jgi:uncharacterized protein YegL